uniref:Acetyl-coenzyme A carboxylase carboxyl transferase subunit beta, chloroplastic n=1 Tax=Dichotomosiphon tuberosus TaxID=118263 RepID=A0A386AWW3_9CHLO|nr:acetyl-CoA carboxylase, carboxyl transferase subunit beta [Dichotomosiphon tuberosus]
MKNELNQSELNESELNENKLKSGLWVSCDKCGSILYIKYLKANYNICLSCDYHLLMNSYERIKFFIDLETWQPFDETLSSGDPLNFKYKKNYKKHLKEAQENNKIQDAIITGTGFIENIPIALAVMNFNFMGGSMGSVVGEKITRLIEYATIKGLILIIVCASGGARMQEGILSLMQMAKISSSLRIYQRQTNLLYIPILTSPTTGGVTASFAMLGDLILAEPLASIGFAGRRIIEQTLNETLPDNFQKAESIIEYGLLDLIIPRFYLKPAIYEIISLHKKGFFSKKKILPKKLQISMNFINEEKNRIIFNKVNKNFKIKFNKNIILKLNKKLFNLFYKEILLSLKKLYLI